MNFTQNVALRSGSEIFGGLLDRCTVSNLAEVRYSGDYNYNDVISGIHYNIITSITNIDPDENGSVKFVAMLVAIVCAGIFLVAFLLALNLTVATGTINGLIFYANIVGANDKVLFHFTTPNLVTVFLSWLNLELGFDTCFFEGMDTYWKTWLQLLFSTYVILLVTVVIIVSEHSTRFA